MSTITLKVFITSNIYFKLHLLVLGMTDPYLTESFYMSVFILCLLYISFSL